MERSSIRVAYRYLTARGKAKKDVGHGGLDEWFSGHVASGFFSFDTKNL